MNSKILTNLSVNNRYFHPHSIYILCVYIIIIIIIIIIIFFCMGLIVCFHVYKCISMLLYIVCKKIHVYFEFI